jgi:chaperonin GroEL
MPKSKTRRVVFQPTTYQGLQRGINQMVEAIRPTLGPQPRIVAIDRILDERMPELLDDGGIIARRIIQLADRNADVGAMLVREVLWRLHDQVGDGTATAAVVFQAVFNEGVRYLASGGNATRLHHYLQQGMNVILDQLTDMTVRVAGKEKLAQIAQSICYDPPLAKLLGEIFDIIGEYGRLEVRPGRSRELEREYVEGMYWERGLVSREMITDQQRVRTEFEDGAILISDLDIEEPQQLFPALELAIKANIRGLLIVAGKVSDKAIGFLLANKKPEKFQAVAVKTPGWGTEEQAWGLEDLAVLTGGRPFIKATGDTFNQIEVEDFGQARRIWADYRNFGIIGGKGSPRVLRQHIATLRASFDESEEMVLREKLLKRIGKLMGGSATLWVGGATELQITEREELAKRTAAAMRGAIMEGVLPGGGVSLLACRPALRSLLDESADSDARAAYRILIKALEAPIRAIVSNAGYDASDAMAEIKLIGPDHGFDVTSGQVANMMQAGIWDAAVVQKSAVYTAIASAGLALTIDVLIHHAEQPGHPPGHTPSKRKRL